MFDKFTNPKKAASFFLADAAFILLVFVYALFSWKGILDMSGHGAILDSDLQTYAQGMAGEAFPKLFNLDPVLNAPNAANSIPNLQRMLASSLLVENNFGEALLSAGSIAIFVFYTGWYLFGRLLFRYPSLSAALALLMGITVWVGWGTFWGISHSDPVPRVFFGAAFPFLLLFALFALRRAALRPLCMLATGLGMWLHGVSALNCGAMFFTAFFFIKAPGHSLSRHLGNLFLCLLAFLLPVLYFLWPSLAQTKSFDSGELALFSEVFDLRWQRDYSDFGQRLIQFFSLSNPAFLVILCGLLSWLVIFRRSRGLLGALCKMLPCFIFALSIVSAFCWAESRFAPSLGRLPMGHELIRGIRFCIPLSWIMLIGLCSLFMPRALWRFALALLVGGIFLFTNDRQYMAAQYAISEYSGLHMPLQSKALEEREQAIDVQNLISMLKREIPEGEAIFCDEDLMAIRYMSLRPLVHAFKDGYVFFYNKDFPRSEKWLNTEKLIRGARDGYMSAWIASGAPWFLSRNGQFEDLMAPYGDLVAQSGDWRLYKRKVNGV